MALKVVGSNPIIHPRNKNQGFCLGFLFSGNKWIMGFERPLRKVSGGHFSGRGRIHGKPTALRKECWRLSILWCISLQGCALYQLIVPLPCENPPLCGGFFAWGIMGFKKSASPAKKERILRLRYAPLRMTERTLGYHVSSVVLSKRSAPKDPHLQALTAAANTPQSISHGCKSPLQSPDHRYTGSARARS